MTLEDQRVAIAKVCGTLACPGCAWEQTECLSHDHKVPYYPEDLNAMHEAEKQLSNTERHHYEDLLKLVCASDSYPLPSNCMATAAQRAEAFLKTLTLWT